MADKKISALTAATTPLAGTEVLPIVQSGSTVKVANNDLRPKQIQSNATSGVLQVVGPAAAATRVMTVPDANFTAARTDAANSFTGDQTLSTGNLIQGTASKGFNFTANSSAAGMTSQLLNYYEEGTWTPALTGSTSNPTVTYTAQNGWYTRVGRQITATFIVQYSALSGGSGDVRISLPFTGGTAIARGGAIYVYGVTPPANTYSMCLEEVLNGTAYVGIICSISGGAFASINYTNMPTGTGTFRGTMTYFA